VQNRIISKLALSSIVLLLPAVISAATVIKLEMPYLKPGAAMPKKYTAEGKSASPPLIWSFAPETTLEYALVFEDLDDSRVHWLVYRIPGKITALPEGIPSDEVLSAPSKLAGAIQGITGFRQKGPGYMPPVSGHRYQFTLYAIDARLGLLPGLDKESLLTLIQGHVVGKGELVLGAKK
jgi:Raf kinase inhibitor-like YbhB/YbcL family protein